MTQAPIETRHKDKALDIWMARSAEQAIAQTLANLEAAWADLAEIDRIARAHGWNIPDCEGLDIGDVAAIAAPYRASDPVAEALKASVVALGNLNDVRESWIAEQLQIELASRGLEIVERRDR